MFRPTRVICSTLLFAALCAGCTNPNPDAAVGLQADAGPVPSGGDATGGMAAEVIEAHRAGLPTANELLPVRCGGEVTDPQDAASLPLVGASVAEASDVALRALVAVIEGVFAREPSSSLGSGEGLAWGPLSYGAGGVVVGTVRPAGAPSANGRSYTFEVLVGAAGDPTQRMARLLWGSSEIGDDGAVTRWLVWDTEAGRDPARPLTAGGRIALRYQRSASGTLVSVAFGEWGEVSSPLRGTLSFGELSARADGPTRFCTFRSWLDTSQPSDGIDELVVLGLAWRPGRGAGRGEMLISRGSLLARQATVVECWAGGGRRTLLVANDGAQTYVDPPGGSSGLCGEFGSSLLEAKRVPREAFSGPAIAELTAAAHAGLHRSLSFERREARVLWVGAHPDDELNAAPLLGRLCSELGGSCTLLVATDGAGGACAREGVCGGKDLGAVRRAEMVKAAAALGAELIQWRWRNGPYPGATEQVLASWQQQLGSEEALVAELRQLIEARRPEIVLGLDPRHGGPWSCHAEHRVLARLLHRALALSSHKPEAVYYVQHVTSPPRFADRRQLVFDASSEESWSYLTGSARAHASQLSNEALATFEAIFAPLRQVYLLDAQDVADDDPRYQICPNP